MLDKKNIISDNDFKVVLHKYLKENRVRKYKFAEKIGVSNQSLHRYCENEAPIPLKVKLAIMHVTKNKIKFKIEN